MSQIPKGPGPRRAIGGSILELRLSSAVVCGLSAAVLQVAALERASAYPDPIEEPQATSTPDPDCGVPAPAVASRRGQAQLGNAPSCGGPPAVGNPLPDTIAVSGPAACESALTAAALVTSRRLAAHPLRGPPRLPS